IEDYLPGQPVAQTIARLTTVVAIGGFFTLPFVFPDGRFVPRWMVIWGILNIAGVAAFAFFPDSGPRGTPWVLVEAIETGLMVLSLVFSVVYRYRKVSTPEQRRQTRWVAFGLMIGLPGFFAGDAMMRNIDASPLGVACLLGFLTVMPIASTLPTVTIGIAILNHRLYDIDVILNRTLVWLTLTGAVTVTYIGMVIGVGGLIGSRDNLVLSLVTTGLVAVGFQPLRLRVQRLADRFLFGDRDDPYAVLARLGHHIEDSLGPADLLPAIVRTTAEMLRLPYAALFLERGGGPVLVAASGVAPTSTSTVRLPLVYQGQAVGALEVANRAPGEVFGQADRRLLGDLARQIGVAARTVSLADDVQRSRELIVTSREEERRRLRRDLHDGLGAQLAALVMQAGIARRLVRSDRDAAERELTDLREELRAAITEVRRLVLGLRPPALDELGLAGALRARLERLDRGGLAADAAAPRVRFAADDPLAPLSAAAEVAAYRIVEEAVTNAVKHAAARSISVDLRCDTAALMISVSDDGVGIAPPVDGSGIGLHSIRERATELGGTCAIGAGPDGRGTLVRVRLPVAPATGGGAG
ncbi:MAG: GAF domain-containing sensor histidine kinase, partial [Thermomicrobiales bacterium]